MSYRDEFFDKPLERAFKFEDLTGKIFDKLTIVKLVGRRIYNNRKSGAALWQCKCECGNIKNIPSSQLKAGKARSCSCYLREYRSLNMRNKFDEQHSAKTQIFLSYKKGAEDRKIPFELTKELLINLSQKNCHYCGSGLSNTKKLKYRKSFKYNGIDRVNNELGYIEYNVVSCCSACNEMKMDRTAQEFLNHIKIIYLNNFGNKHE